MKQIILTVEDNSLVPKIKAAARMLRGVVSVRVNDNETDEKPNRETLESIDELKCGKCAGKLDNSSRVSLLDSMLSL